MHLNYIEFFIKDLKQKTNFREKIIYKLHSKCEICYSKSFQIISLRSLLSSIKNIYCFMPYGLCKRCGHAQQLIHFNRKFYNNYYNKILLENTFGNKNQQIKLNNSIARGKYVLNYLKKKLKMNFKNKFILDIGCGYGGMLVPFYKSGAKVLGIDSSKNVINFTKKKIKNLNLKTGNAEDIRLKKNSTDLIIINGSLEHVKDPNKVLKKASFFLKENGIIYLEGKGYPHDIKDHFFNFSHHRIFTKSSFTNLCAKYSISMIHSTYNSPVNILKLIGSSYSHNNQKSVKNNLLKSNLIWIGIKNKKKKKNKIYKDHFFMNVFKKKLK